MRKKVSACLSPFRDLRGFTVTGRISLAITSGASLVWGIAMTSLAIRKILFAGAALALTLTQAAHAGGIGIHEQSAAGQGMSFAGQGTSSLGLSSMFWNPAAVTQTNGFGMESHTTFLFGNTVITPDAGGLTAVYGPQDSGNISEFAYIPTTYMAYRLNPNWYVGLSVTAPFGSGTHPDGPWAGSFYTKEARLKSVDFNPVIGWKLNDQLSIAAGPRVVWLFNGKFSRTSAPVIGFNSELNNLGDVAIGWSAGLTWKPTPFTEIALGYRSRVDTTLEGNITLPVLPGGGADVKADATLPDSLSFGIKQRIDSRWSFLGSVEWTNWSVLDTAPFIITSGPAAGTNPTAISFLYKDGWFFSAGLEYKWDAWTTLRGGVAYEVSPSKDQFRLLGVPDDNRWWFSVGATHKWTEQLSSDIGYSFVWLGDSPINYTASNPNTLPVVVPLTGTSHSYYNIISVSLRYAFDPEVRAPLITK